ncbi:SpoIID/LytB domain-containing protein [Bdellovibrionota bacterium FG-2]
MAKRRILYYWLFPILITMAIGAESAFAFVERAPQIRLAPQAASSLQIRVKLADALPHVQLRGFDLRLSEKQVTDASRFVDKMSEWEFRCQEGRIRATSPRLEGKTLDLAEPVVVQTPAGFLSFRGMPYRETLKIYSQGSFCEVINEVDLEKYLDGLVNAEFSSKWNEEAIAAQVVAARTYAYYKMKHVREADPQAHYDVDSTVIDQVYDGSIKEDFRASKSVARTRGWILTESRASATPIKAFYHSTCGGGTDTPERVWGERYPGFKRGVSCGYCTSSPQFRWNFELRASDVVAGFRRGVAIDGAAGGWRKDWSAILKLGRLGDLQVLGDSRSGRATKVRTFWRDALGGWAELSVSSARFRGWMGSERLKSTGFQVSPLMGTAGVWRVEGRGFGHGVGMCQYGAKTMGEKGFNVSSILRYYYPDAELRKLW